MCVSRFGAIFSGVVCLIEGLVWLGLCVIGLLAFQCKLQVDSKPIEAFLSIYFNYGKCFRVTIPGVDELPNYSFGDYLSTPIPIPTWPESVSASERTEIWLLVYVTLTVTWLFTSVLLIIGASIETKGPMAAVFYLPWLVNTFTFCVTDVVGAIMYGLDISKTTTLIDFLKFVGVNNLDTISSYISYEELEGTQIYTVVPSVVMTVIFARGLLLWLFNFILFLTTALALKNNLENYKVKTQKEGDWRNVSKLWLTQPPPRKDSTESVPPAGQENPWQTRPVNRAPPTRRYDYDNAAPPTRRYDNDNSQDMIGIENNFHAFVRAEDEGRSSFRENGLPSAEIRNGLPWSYFSHRDELKRPPKPDKNILEPMPPVPPPDYTLRFPQFNRPGISKQRSTDYASSWSSKDSIEGGKPNPYIPSPDYDKKRHPPRMMARQPSQESSIFQAPQPGGSNKQPPYIPQPDYEKRRSAPKLNMKQALEQIAAARAHTNHGYLNTERDGYQHPHIPSPDYAKPNKPMQRGDNLRDKPLYIISGGNNPAKGAGRSREFGNY